MVYADPAVRRQRDRERVARRTAARIEAGLCVRCGRTEPLPERRLCAPCNDKRNAASRDRDARLRAARKPRRDPERARQYERDRSRTVYAERVAAGICTKCGRAEAVPDRTTCEPCAVKHRARDRDRYPDFRNSARDSANLTILRPGKWRISGLWLSRTACSADLPP